MARSVYRRLLEDRVSTKRPKTEKTDASLPAGDVMHPSGRVLIVEPEPLLRWSMSTYLSRWFEVFPTDDDAAAERVLGEHAVDALIVSDQLPREEAADLEAHARTLNTDARIVRTVTTRENGLTPACIEKPFELAALARMLGVREAPPEREPH